MTKIIYYKSPGNQYDFKNGSLSFLNIINITHESNKFVTSVYLKPAYIGILANFKSVIPDMYKCGLTETLFYRSLRMCSSYEYFHREVVTLNSIFKSNYAQNFVNHCIKKIVNNFFVSKIHLRKKIFQG